MSGAPDAVGESVGAALILLRLPDGPDAAVTAVDDHSAPWTVPPDWNR